jgi:glycosyltransferase involved in cell wall biosynthesis
VRFLGHVPHEDLNRYYSAADVMVLASFREGWPNVLLEALACGTPVVATAVGAIPDFIDDPCVGRVIQKRTAPDIAAAIRTFIEKPPARWAVREYATRFGWGPTIQQLLILFSEVVGEGQTQPRSLHGHSVKTSGVDKTEDVKSIR